MSDWRESAKKSLQNKLAGQTYKLSEGQNCFRILPNREGLGKPPYVEFNAHGSVGTHHRLVACGKSLTGEGKCWLCDVMIPKMEGSNNTKRVEAAEEMRAATMIMFQVAKFSPDNDTFMDPQRFLLRSGGGRALSTSILSTLIQSKSRVSHDHPKAGKNYNVTRTGTTMLNTRYSTVIPDEEPTPLPPGMKSKIKPFSELVSEYSLADQKEAFYGREEDREEEEESKQRSRKSSRKTTSKPKDKPEDDDWESEDSGDPPKDSDAPEPKDSEDEDGDWEEEESEEPEDSKDPEDSEDEDPEDESGDSEGDDWESGDSEDGDSEDGDSEDSEDDDWGDSEPKKSSPKKSSATKKSSSKKKPPTKKRR